MTEIDFWNMECVKVNDKHQLRKLELIKEIGG